MIPKMHNTIGDVPRGPSNRYWQFTLSSKITGIKVPLVYLFWLLHTCLIFLYSLILCIGLHMRYGKPTHSKGTTQSAINFIPEFIDIYPTSVYPLVVKSLELAHYAGQRITEPSLEIATGDGFFTNKLCGIKGSKVTIASDLIGHTLVQANKYTFWRKLAIFDSMQIPLPDNSLSTVIMNNLIHHLPSRIDVLKEIHRVLAPGGTFIFTDELSGWATSQWHIGIRKILGGKNYEDNLKKFLTRSVQCLLDSDKFYRDLGMLDSWDVYNVKKFFSARGMFLSSFLETLNRKMGSPTSKPIRDILNRFPLMGKAQRYLTKSIAELLITKDDELCEQHGATSVFVVLIKKGSPGPVPLTGNPELVCPCCKGEIHAIPNGIRCAFCGQEYPLFRGDIPILISYHKDLPREYQNDIGDKVLPEVSC